MSESVVEVWRGSLVESRHQVHIAVVDATGRLRAGSGDVNVVTYARSAVKPLQTLPLLEDGVVERFGFTEQEISLCCASHNGETLHTDGVRGMLRKVGVGEDALACGAHVPMSSGAARALAVEGLEPSRIHNNCSGKHAGMLALARYHGWPVASYHQQEHPVQQRMLREMARWSNMPADDIPVAIDGCGVITFALPLARLARAFAAFAGAARRVSDAASGVVGAMVRHPEYVGGTQRLCTDLMRTAGGRIVAKVGAEGVYCVGVPGAELGIAIKVADGATRAAEPALIAVLRKLGLLADDEVEMIAAYAEPGVVNTRGERVGTIRAAITLEAAT